MFLPRDSGPSAGPVVGSEFGTTPDTLPEARFNSIGIGWTTFGAVWTLCLICGMVFLYQKRNTATLRLRGLFLTFTGITFLHLYWMTVQLGYSIGPLAPEQAEFWIMSLWYPFGIALFQAGNSQFYHVAKAQGRYARPPSQMSSRYDDEKRPLQRNSYAAERLRKMDYSKKMFLLVSSCMMLQLIVVVVIYNISRKFHPSYGLPGTEVHGNSPMEIAMQQGRGWEWFPSIVWQFFWAWIWAPINLWRSRGIHDTHGWQLQTIACCVAGLHAAPMWLIALYVPDMAPVNSVFIPPQWIALSIFVIEIFTVFVPCWQVRKHQTLRAETLESIANWESKKCLGGGTSSDISSQDSTIAVPLSPTSTSGTKIDRFSGINDTWKKLPSLESDTTTTKENTQSEIDRISDDSILTMAALEHVLDKNPEPLRQFSAKRDFSGENIAFLTAVAEWKASLPVSFVRGGRNNVSDATLREQFTRALHIYTEFISSRDAEFPINIAWHDLRKLEGIFERAARHMLGDSSSTADSATPFAEVDYHANTPTTSCSQVAIVCTTTPLPDTCADITPPPTAQVSERKNSDPCTLTLTAMVEERELYTGDIPQTFDANIFDAAQASIKYLVLTNTWPKYVRERRNSESSAGSRSTVKTGGSGRSKRSLQELWRSLGFLKPALN